MHTTVHTSLIRQSKALALLCELMEEEYQTLLGHNTDAVVALEFSIQELIRQLAAEKATVMKALAGVRVTEYAATLPQAEGAALLDVGADTGGGGDEGPVEGAAEKAQGHGQVGVSAPIEF